MDQQTFDFLNTIKSDLVDAINDVKDDTGTIRSKQDDHEQRFAAGNLRFQDHANKIENLENNKVSVDDFRPVKESVKTRDRKEKAKRKVITQRKNYKHQTNINSLKRPLTNCCHILDFEGQMGL